MAVEDTDSIEEIAKIFAENGYSRLPVYHEDIDNIIGVIHEKDFHAARYRGLTSVKEMLGPMLYTTGNTKISELLRILQREKAHMVIVVDEYGGTEGLVTLEEIVEELVGEIWDEHDEVIEEFKKQEDGSYLISCSADLTDLFDLFKIKGSATQHHLRLGDGADRPCARGGRPLRLRWPGRDGDQGGPPPGAGDPGGGAPGGGELRRMPGDVQPGNSSRIQQHKPGGH